MNRKGQALIEFILILPVFLLILFVIVDFGMIFSSKNSLENYSSDIALMVKNGKSIDDIKTNYDDIMVDVSKDGEYYVINLYKDVKLITPGLNRILDNPYRVNIKRVVYDDKS